MIEIYVSKMLCSKQNMTFRSRNRAVWVWALNFYTKHSKVLAWRSTPSLTKIDSFAALQLTFIFLGSISCVKGEQLWCSIEFKWRINEVLSNKVTVKEVLNGLMAGSNPNIKSKDFYSQQLVNYQKRCKLLFCWLSINFLFQLYIN